MDSWLNMVLLCGLLLLASLQATNPFRLRRSKTQMLETNINELIAHYNTIGPEWVGKSVFAPRLNLLNSKASCKCHTLLLEGMLMMYEEMFQEMLKKSDKKEVKSNLNYVIHEMKNLTSNYSEEQRVWKELQYIHSIKVKTETIQKGALNDFLMVFNRAYTEKHHDRV